MFKNRNSAPADGNDGERIEGIPITRCEEMGKSNRIAADHPRLGDDPIAAEVEKQGVQSRNLDSAAKSDSVNKALTDHAVKSEAVRLLVPELKAEAREAVLADHSLRTFEAEIEKVTWRLPLLTEGSAVLMWIVLLVIALGEFVLNRFAFEITGEDQMNVDVLAITAGVALVAGAHSGGYALRRLFDRLDGAKANPVSLVLSSVLLALGLAVFGIGGLRSAFFAEEGATVPSGWLMGLQAFLLWVAVVMSMAHASPLRNELIRRKEVAADARQRLAEIKGRWLSMRRAELDAEAACRTVMAQACWSYHVQDLHTDRQSLRYAAGVQETTGKPISAEATLSHGLDSSLERACGNDPIVATWLQWLASHPAPAPAAVVDELDRLLESIAPLPAEASDKPVDAAPTDSAEAEADAAETAETATTVPEPEDTPVVSVTEPGHPSSNGEGVKV
ncbi:MAG: hypothetical protein AMXMBFR46_17600 [Acidimicrobiia bacterium]